MKTIKTTLIGFSLLASSNVVLAGTSETASVAAASGVAEISVKKKVRAGKSFDKTILTAAAGEEQQTADIFSSLQENKKTLLLKNLPDHLVAANP